METPYNVTKVKLICPLRIFILKIHIRKIIAHNNNLMKNISNISTDRVFNCLKYEINYLHIKSSVMSFNNKQFLLLLSLMLSNHLYTL